MTAPMPTRKPMTFNIPPVAAPASSVDPVPPAEGAEPRQQVGARVPRAVYRELKARAALAGVPVQALVEQAIADFLAKGK